MLSMRKWRLRLLVLLGVVLALLAAGWIAMMYEPEIVGRYLDYMSPGL